MVEVQKGSNLSSQMAISEQEMGEKIQNLEQELKRTKREGDHKLAEAEKEKLIIEQKVEFLIQEKQEALVRFPLKVRPNWKRENLTKKNSSVWSKPDTRMNNKN